MDRRLLLALAAGLAIVLAIVGYYTFSTSGGVSFSDAYATYTGAVIGVYGKLQNNSGERVCIESIKLAEGGGMLKAELHRTVREGSIYRMMPAGRVCLEPGEELELRPGGYHIMVMPVEKGEEGSRALEEVVSDGYVEIVVVLSNGESVEVRAPVRG